MIPSKETIIEKIRSSSVGVKTRKLVDSLGLSEDEFTELVELLMKLQKDGQLVRVPGKGWHTPEKTDYRVGVIFMTRAGAGIVNGVGAGQGDIYVPPGMTASALHGDLVLTGLVERRPAAKRGRSGRVSPSKRPELPEGRVVDVVERRSALVRGHYARMKGGKRGAQAAGFVEPIDERVGGTVYIPPGKSKEAKDGRKVLVKLLGGHAYGDHPRGEIVHVVEDEGTLNSDLESIVAEFGLAVDLPQSAVEQAASLPGRVGKRDEKGREDLRGLLTFTIDPDDAKDFDDAVSMTPLEGGGCQLGVHIADVSYYVEPGSALDRAAQERGTSIYLPGRVIPMLPESLSNGLASLRPNEDRLTKSVFIDFAPSGQVVGTRIARSIIRSQRRFTYNEVLAILTEIDSRNGKEAGSNAKADGSVETLELPEDAATYFDILGQMADLRDLLHARRAKRGCLELEIPSVRLHVDPKTGETLGLLRDESDPSHQLIEEFMLAANEAVAGFLGERGLPIIARIHSEPSEENLDDFFGLAENVIGKPSGRDLQSVIDAVRGEPYESVVSMALLRSLPHAKYSAEASLHFALATSPYCHFTSPIRRYPDLIVHRILDEHWDGNVKSVSRRAYWDENLPQFAAACSESERRAENAERAMSRVRLLRYLEPRVGEELEGVITSVHPFGFFVQEDEQLIDGLVHVATLGNDFYELDEKRYCLCGRRHGDTFRVGDRVRVVLDAVDPDLREVRFRFAGKTARSVRERDHDTGRKRTRTRRAARRR